MRIRSIVALPVLLIACLLADGALAAQRAFVASHGNDGNAGSGCSLAAPCRTFATAINQVDAGGEIVALDAAGYGAVAIAKSVTITTNAGYFAGIAASTATAISIVAPDLDVVLRGLSLNGVGAATGVEMAQPGRLTMENCVVSNFAQNGIEVTDSGAHVWIVDTIVRGNGGSGQYNGIFISGGTASLNNVKMSRNARAGLEVRTPTGGGETTVAVFDSDSSFNTYGYMATRVGTGWAYLTILRSSASKNSYAGVLAAISQTWISVGFSHISGNATGLSNPTSAGILQTYGNNILKHNGVTTEGTVSTVIGD